MLHYRFIYSKERWIFRLRKRPKGEKIYFQRLKKQYLVKKLLASSPRFFKKNYKNPVSLGEFLVYGDQVSEYVGVQNSGQIIHLNLKKLTLRRGQPIYVSPKAVLHKYEGDFIEANSPVITLAYQRLKTGDIIQGIPKVEQFFEARTTKRGRFFQDSLPNLCAAIFQQHRRKLPLKLAVRQSFLSNSTNYCGWSSTCL